jgi:hypothetical protein
MVIHVSKCDTAIPNTEIVSRDATGETIVVPICRGVEYLDSVYGSNRKFWARHGAQ